MSRDTGQDPVPLPPQDERDLDAGLFAIGLLEGADAARATRREADEPAFAAAVAAWRARLSELDETAEPGSASADLWRRIEDSIEVTTSALATPSPATRPEPARRAARSSWLADLWNSLPAWRGLALASAAAALILAVGLGTQRQASPVMVAVLLTDANRVAALVDVYADGRAELLPLEPIAVPDDRTLQVWTLWDRARGPVSLGLLDRARQIRLPVESLPRTVPNQLFEITLEPKAGSPTGRPTGPILMKGTTSPTL